MCTACLVVFDRMCALEARLICILLTLSVGGHFPKSWNANWSVYSSRRIWLSFLCSFTFSYLCGADLCSIVVGREEIPDPEVEKTLHEVC